MFRLFSALAFAGLLAVASPGFAAPPPPVEDYGKLPAMEMVSLSPSGDRYAFVAGDGAERRLFILTTANVPIEVIKIGPVKVIGVEWAGDDFVLVQYSATVQMGFYYLIAKQELSSVIVVNLRTHKMMGAFERAQHRVAPAVYGDYGTAEIKGRWYGFFGGESLETSPSGEDRYSNQTLDGDVLFTNTDLYRVDLETGEAQRIATGQENSDGWLVNPQGEVVARLLYDEKSAKWQILTGSYGGRLLASGHESLGGVELMGFSRTADAILVSHHNDNGLLIEELPLEGGQGKTIDPDLAAYDQIRDVHTGLWIGSLHDGDEPVSVLFAPELEAKVKGAQRAFPGYRMALKSFNADFNRMIVFTDGGDDSGTYWIVDVAKKSAVPLGEAYPTVTAASVGPVRMVQWKAADGLALSGVLTLPPGREAKNLPLVVMPHGGPVDRDYPGFDYWPQAFASRGYAVFQPNFRGSSGYGENFIKAGFGEWGRKMQTDVSDGAAELARQGIVDPKRACIVGWSYGGYAALAGVTVQQGLYRCSVSMAGVADLARFFNYKRTESGDSDSSTTRFWKAFMGADSNWNGLAAISPVKLASRADAPILLIHGKDDTTVPIDQSDAMERALKAAGKPVERLTLDHADHWLLEQDARMAMVKASVAFVERYNPPDSAEAPAAAH